MEAQELFDKAVNHLRMQGCKSETFTVNGRTVSNSICLYRGPNNTKCAMGALIEDEEYHPWMDGAGTILTMLGKPDCPQSLKDKLYPHIGLCQALQSIHDSHPVYYWEESFAAIAESNKLVYTPKP